MMHKCIMVKIGESKKTCKLSEKPKFNQRNRGTFYINFVEIGGNLEICVIIGMHKQYALLA